MSKNKIEQFFLLPRQDTDLFGTIVLADSPCVINLQCFQSAVVCCVMVLMALMQSQHITHLFHIKGFPAFHMLLFQRTY